MSDVFSPSKRSEVMSKIRGTRNKSTELRLIGIFRKFAIKGWRRNAPVLGKPDFVFKGQRIAVFVDGCFWHACPKCSYVPKQNAEFWQTKLARNVARDTDVTRRLRGRGWKVVRIWEHDLQNERRIVRRIGIGLEQASRTERRRAA